MRGHCHYPDEELAVYFICSSLFPSKLCQIGFIKSDLLDEYLREVFQVLLEASRTADTDGMYRDSASDSASSAGM